MILAIARYVTLCNGSAACFLPDLPDMDTVSGKIPISGKILPGNISVFKIGETGVKTLEQ